MSDRTKTPMTELMEQAMKNYEQALQSGLKLQEESTKWWTDLISQTAAPADWQKRWRSTASQTIPVVQKRMEEALRVVEQSSRTSLNLLKQALALTVNDSAANTQTKLQELWEASLEAVRNNAQALTQANARVVESWMQLLSGSAEPEPSTTKGS